MNTTYRIDGTSGINLNGNELSGSTYAIKKYIQGFLDGKWNSEKGVWIINLKKFNELVEKRCITSEAQTLRSQKHAHTAGPCPRCHTYCDGDCATQPGQLGRRENGPA